MSNYGDDNQIQLTISVGYDGTPVVQQVQRDLASLSNSAQQASSALLGGGSPQATIQQSAALYKQFTDQLNQLGSTATQSFLQSAQTAFAGIFGGLMDVYTSSARDVTVKATALASAINQGFSQINYALDTASAALRARSVSMQSGSGAGSLGFAPLLSLPMASSTPGPQLYSQLTSAIQQNTLQSNAAVQAFALQQNASRLMLGNGGAGTVPGSINGNAVGFQNLGPTPVYATSMNNGWGGGPNFGGNLGYVPPGRSGGGTGNFGGSGWGGGPPPIPPATLSSYSQFNNVMGTLSSVGNTVMNMAMSLARQGFYTLTAEMAASLAAAKELADQFIQVNEKFATLSIGLQSSFGSQSLAADTKNAVIATGQNTSIPLQTLADFTRMLSTMPTTKQNMLQQASDGSLNDPQGFYQKAVLLEQQMLAFRPDRSPDQINFSLQQAQNGEFRSFVRTMGISEAAVAQMGGTTAKALNSGGDASVTLGDIEKLFNTLVPASAVQAMQNLPTNIAQKLKDQLITIPLLSIGDAGLFPQVQNSLQGILSAVKQVTSPGVDASGNPTSSLLSQATPQVAAALGRVVDSLVTFGHSALEQILSQVGFGSETMGGGVSTAERALIALTAGINLAADKLPGILQQGLDFLTAVVPALTKMGEIALQFATTWAQAFTNFPIATFLGTAAALGVGQQIPNFLGQAIGGLPSPSGVTGLGWNSPLFTGVSTTTAGPNPTLAPAGSGANLMKGITVAALTVGSMIFAYEATDMFMKWLGITGEAEGTTRAANAPATDAVGAQIRSDPNYRASLIQTIQQDLNAKNANANNTNFDDNGMPLGGTKDALKAANSALLALNVPQSAVDNIDQLKTWLTMAQGLINSFGKDASFQAPTDPKVAIANLQGFFQTPFNKGGPATSLQDAFRGGGFKGTIGDAEVANQQLGVVQSSPILQQAGSYIQTAATKDNPFAQALQQGNAVLGVIQTVNDVTAKMSSALGSGSTIDTQAQTLTQNFQDALTKLQNSHLSENTQITASDTVGTLSKKYQDFIAAMQTDATGRAAAVTSAIISLQTNNLVQQSNALSDSLGAATKLLDTFSAPAISGTSISSADIQNNTTKMKAFLAKIGPTLLSSASDQINIIEQSFETATNPDKAQSENMKGDAASAKQAIQLIFDNYGQTQIAALQAQLAALFPPTPTMFDLSNPSAAQFLLNTGVVPTTFNTSRIPTTRSSTLTQSPLIQNGVTSQSLNNSLPLPGSPDTSSIDGNTLMGMTTASGAVLAQTAATIANVQQAQSTVGSVGQTLDSGLKSMAATSGSQAAAAYGKGTDAKTLENQINEAIGAIQQVFQTAQTLTAGPLQAYETANFQKQIGALATSDPKDFASLQTTADANMSTLFAEVKAGNAGVDAFYDKMKATSDLAGQMSLALRSLAGQQTDPAEANKLNLLADAQAKLQAQSAQQVYTLDQNNNPITSFDKGFQTIFSSAQHNMFDLQDTGKQVATSLQNDFGTAFQGFVMGTMTAKQAFTSFATSMLGDLSKIAAEQAFKAVIGIVMQLGGTALGGLGGGVASADAATLLGPSGATGLVALAGGGSVVGGSGMRDDVPAMLTGGEYVVTKEQARKHYALLDAINNGTIHHYATGGVVTSDLVTPANPNTVAGSQATNRDNSNSTVSIVVNRHEGANSGAQPDNETTKRNKADQDAELGRQIKLAVLQVINQEMRTGGRFTRR